ncbi:MAG: gliding motility-associated lipoprotein [Flavobacteriales bacterium]|nr:gliding motility-associated lipoprotein [Flavobacteriales bacterium]|tara:strand:- start:57406 stop:58788 length:1383 start_codon:yes stop_codon:yes gene_type:complete
MKKIILISSVVALLGACAGSGNGELIGVQDRPVWNPEDPYGMVFIPQGSFTMGPSDQDVPFANISQAKTVSVGAFYMDETEITNNEYRQFTNWVRDSLIRSKLMMIDESFRKKYAYDNARGEKGDDIVPYQINWRPKLKLNDANWMVGDNNDVNAREYLQQQQIFLGDDQLIDGLPQFNTTLYVYTYKVFDVQKASVKSQRIANNSSGEGSGRKDFIHTVDVNIFPDTLTWTHDYSYSFNDPYTKNYFWHPAFDDYPVVGVNWKQANAFSHWRTKMMNQFLRRTKQPTLPDFRLPTETEWEYAARGGYESSPYPWGGPYTRNVLGCFLANFKPLRGNYVQDGGLKSIKVASYNPNKYGLYDMAGNVAEWTSNAFDESAFSYTHDLNMDYHYNAERWDDRSLEEDINEVMKRKVIRGGSWKDVAYFVQNSTRTFEYQDTSKSYIGFRCVVDFLGRDKKDFQ